jgi:cell division protein ZapE
MEQVADPAAASFLDAYRRRLDDGWQADPAQRAAVGQLNQLLTALKASPVKPPQSLYLHGPVGRGKSQLLDMFVAHLGEMPARRTHMHAFMEETHRRLHAMRGGDPILMLAKELRAECRVLGFDEFYITNIADAILLGRLFEHLFKQGIVIVATSNWQMDDLYVNGRNRKAFMPFLRLLKQHLQPVDLGDGTDYRQPAHPDWPLVAIGTPQQPATDDLVFHFDHHAQGAATEPPAGIIAKAFAGRCGWYRFDDICRRALGRAEYSRLAEHADTVIVEDVPLFTKDDSDAALRFVTLIDICYETKRRVILSGAAYPDALYGDGPVAVAFARAASRLAEMQAWDGNSA